MGRRHHRQYEHVRVPEDVPPVGGTGEASGPDRRFSGVADRGHEVKERQPDSPGELDVAHHLDVGLGPARGPCRFLFGEQRPGVDHGARSWGRIGSCRALHLLVGPLIGGMANNADGPRSFRPSRLGLAPSMDDDGDVVAEGRSIGDGLGAGGLEDRGSPLGDEHHGPGMFETSPSGRKQNRPAFRVHGPPQDARTQVEYPCARRKWGPQRQRDPGGDGEDRFGAVFTMFVDPGHVDAGQGVDPPLLEAPSGPGGPVGHREQAFVDPMPARGRVGHDEHPG